MKHQQNIPLVAHTDQVNTHRPSVATDHSLPIRHALTEALIITCIGTGLTVAVLITTNARQPSWLWSGFVIFIMFGVVLLKRYEDHVNYIRDDRRPEPPAADLDQDGQPDRVHAVWYGNGAPAAAPGTLAATYSLNFAAFVVACQRVGTTGRALRAEGFDDNLQNLFRNWLMQYQAAHWISSAGHNPGWELDDEATVRRVLRCTGWLETT